MNSSIVQVTPSLRRRLACWVYEGVLLFGIVMVAGFAYSTLTQQRHAMIGTTGLRAVVFVVLGLYFAGFWSSRGQTLAMQTWKIRLVSASGDRVTWLRAAVRYLLSWLWFLPALLSLHLAGLSGTADSLIAVAVGVVAYAALAWLRPDRQYWHDAICGTRLVLVQPQVRP